MRDYIEERAIHIAQYIVDNGATVRQTARQFGVSKSTVHKDVTQRLIQINPRLAFQTRIILDINKSERHIRGGMATREKYRHHTQNVTFSSNIHAPCGNTEYSDTHSKDSEFPQVHRRTPQIAVIISIADCIHHWNLTLPQIFTECLVFIKL